MLCLEDVVVCKYPVGPVLEHRVCELRKVDQCSLSEIDLLDLFPLKVQMATSLEPDNEVPSKVGDLAVAEALTGGASPRTLQNLAAAVLDPQVHRLTSAHP